MKKLLLSIMAVCMLFVSTGCGKEPVEPTPNNTNSDNHQAVTPDAEKNKTVEVNLYMGYRALIDNFKTVKVKMQEPVTPEKLIDAIAKEGGWNLELVDDVRKDDDGYHIKFTSNSLLGSGENLSLGNPGEQKEQYFCYDTVSLTQMILGSIQKTFDENLAEKGTTMKLYFSVLGNPIKAEENIEFPADQPWNDIYDMYQSKE